MAPRDLRLSVVVCPGVWKGRSCERTVDDVRQRAKDNRKAVFDDAHADSVSEPGDLLEGIDDTIRSTCVQVTGVKLNSSSDEFLVIGVEIRLVTPGHSSWYPEMVTWQGQRCLGVVLEAVDD